MLDTRYLPLAPSLSLRRRGAGIQIFTGWGLPYRNYKRMQNTIITIRALGDNFIYLCGYGNDKAFVVDPGSAQPVEEQLSKNSLALTHVFVTHHHFDHIGRVRELKTQHNCQIIGAYSGVDQIVKDGEVIELDGLEIKVISTPGHTKTSICYYVIDNDNNSAVFTGDTLFVGGCGRPFECSAETMWQSLQKLFELPDETLVYAGHDYTLDNYNFALSIEPDNEQVKKCINELNSGKCCIPSTISQERQTNILFSAKSAKDFAKLRSLKDSWG